MRLRDLTYHCIYAIDNLFDDAPEQWYSLAHLAPPGIEACMTREPCGLLSRLAEEDPAFQLLLGDPALIPLFNGLLHLYARAGDHRRNASSGGIRYLQALSDGNLHASLFARLIQELDGERKEYDAQDVFRLMPLLLAETFVGRFYPKALCAASSLTAGQMERLSDHPEYYIRGDMLMRKSELYFSFDPRGVPSTMEDCLTFELLNFVADDWVEIFADLDTERRSGFYTPNLLATYVRVRHPDADLQQVADTVRQVSRGRTFISFETLKAFHPEIAESIQHFTDIHDVRQKRQPYFYTSDAAKAENREKRRESMGQERG